VGTKLGRLVNAPRRRAEKNRGDFRAAEIVQMILKFKLKLSVAATAQLDYFIFLKPEFGELNRHG
jgi:hypothetical protein